jgi:hypothetical protein
VNSDMTPAAREDEGGRAPYAAAMDRRQTSEMVKKEERCAHLPPVTRATFPLNASAGRDDMVSANIGVFHG